MKFLFIYIVSFVQIFANISFETISINHHEFIMIKETYQEYGDKGSVMKLYAPSDNQFEKPLFHFILEDIEGGCSGKSIEKGSYKIKGSKIIFYTYWSRKGKEVLSPYGARVMEYTVDEKGNLNKLNSHLYIEEHKLEKDENSGMQYLFKAPKTEKERNKLYEYIQMVETRYGGIFLFKKEAKMLIHEVTQAIKEKMKRRWGGVV